MTSRGRVAIPVEMPEALGITAGSAVELWLEGTSIRLVRAEQGHRGRELVRRMRGRATTRLGTDEIMALTGE